MRSRLLLALIAGATLATGCSKSSKYPGSSVTGKVMYGGNPVAGAKVIFVDGNAGGANPTGPTAITDESGEYTMVGVKPGTYKVVIYKLKPKPGSKLPEEGEGMDIEQMEASGQGTHELPAKYAKPATTNLTANSATARTRTPTLI